MEEKRQIKVPHGIILENRSALTVTGVIDIDNFDEETIVVATEEGDLIIKGFNLHINKIDVTTGELTVDGEIYSLVYTDDNKNQGGFFSKLFR